MCALLGLLCCFEILHPLSPACSPGLAIAGDYALSDTESITQMSFWCLWSAPLLMSNDLRAITATQKAILLNTEVIAVDQVATVPPVGLLLQGPKKGSPALLHLCFGSSTTQLS